VIPKGTLLTGFEQEDMTLMANHINSTARALLNGRTLFELIQLLLDKKLIHVAKLKLMGHETFRNKFPVIITGIIEHGISPL